MINIFVKLQNSLFIEVKLKEFKGRVWYKYKYILKDGHTQGFSSRSVVITRKYRLYVKNWWKITARTRHDVSK